MSLSAAVLCGAFRDRAAAVHDLISYSYACGLGVSEETITEVTLVELRRRLHPYVLAQKFTKLQESSTSGADWLMTIGRPGRWISLLVQAKLARPGIDRLDKLHYGKGGQRQTLVAYARQRNYLPLYLIYTSFDGVPTPASSTPPKRGRKRIVPVWSPPCPAAHEDIKQMGCVAVRPRHVALMFRGKAPKNSVADLLSRGRPWSCLFCCPHPTPQIELADAIAAGFGELPIDSPAPLSPGGLKVRDPDDNFAAPRDLITQTPPDVVSRMLQGQMPGHTPFAGAIVVSSLPLDLLVDSPRPVTGR